MLFVGIPFPTFALRRHRRDFNDRFKNKFRLGPDCATSFLTPTLGLRGKGTTPHHRPTTSALQVEGVIEDFQAPSVHLKKVNGNRVLSSQKTWGGLSGDKPQQITIYPSASGVDVFGVF